MTLHRLIVSLMLAWTVVYALLYISTFPAEGEGASREALPTQQAGPESAVPTSNTDNDGAVKRGIAAESPRHLA